MYRWQGRNYEVDADKPRAEMICDRCGFRYNEGKLQYQYDYQGTSSLQNTQLLVCARCYDEPQPQEKPIALPPDPPPVYDARPEPYYVDETNFLTTEDGDNIETEDGDPIIPSPPESDE